MEQSNLEEIASAKDGITCVACKQPYSRIEQLMYCPDHKEITVHADCIQEGNVKDTCTTIGCEKKWTHFLKPKTTEQMNAGIAEKLGKNTLVDEQYLTDADKSNMRQMYCDAVDKYGKKLEDELISLYSLYDKIQSYSPQFFKDEFNFVLRINETGRLEVHFNHVTPFYPSFYCSAFYVKFIEPIKIEKAATNEQGILSRFFTTKSTKSLTENRTKEQSGDFVVSSFEDNKSFDDVLGYIKRQSHNGHMITNITVLKALSKISLRTCVEECCEQLKAAALARKLAKEKRLKEEEKQTYLKIQKLLED